VFVTSQEIDRHGEAEDADGEARRYIDEVLDKLRKGIRRLAALGIRDVILAADHGHLFGEAIESGMKIDAPDGRVADSHRRVWVGRGGNTPEGCLRIPASRVGLGGDLEMVLPRGLACFTVRGGSTSFFHGAASLQELVIPAAVLTTKGLPPAEKEGYKVELTMEKLRVTTRFFSVTALYTQQGLFPRDNIRVEFVVKSNKKIVGRAAMAAYGFEDGTEQVVLEKGKANAVTLMLTDDVEDDKVSVHVLDAATGIEINRLENIAVAIVM
jgi:hypothetical protein